MLTSITVSGFQEVRVMPGVEHAPVMVRVDSDDMRSSATLFLTEAQADELAQLLWNRKVEKVA